MHIMYVYICIYIYICIYMYMYGGYTFLLGEQLSVPSFEKGGSEKMTVWVNLRSFCHAEDFQRENMALSSQFQMLVSACFVQTIR